MARFGVTLLIGAIVVMLPLQKGMASSETANDDEASRTRCDKMNCPQGSAVCTGEDVEVCPVGSTLCFATWMNGSNGTRNIVMKGCWQTPEGCQGKHDCVDANTGRQVGFCCCEGNFCNRNTSRRPQEPTMPPSTSNPPKLGDSKLDSKRIQTFLYSFVPLVGVCFLIIMVYFLWRRHKRNLYVHSPLPAVDPEIMTSPASESLYPLQLIELRARGRFGAVWKAQHADSDYVAVKIFPLQDKQSWTVEQDIYNLPHMKHENILTYMTAERRGDNLSMELWLISEFHENGSVSDYLKGHVITWSELCKIAESMARGLAFLHDEIPASRGAEAKPAVAHRDFKSKNVLLKNDLTACVADFGLALKFEPGKSPGETHGLVGTRRYMAPEVLEGAICFNRDAFLRIDMYACGLVLWELVSRCKTTDSLVGDYQLPFEEEIGPHPTLEDMQDLVVTRKIRPAIKEQWLNHPGLAALVSTIEECWDQDAEARLSAGCVQERISQLSRSLNVGSSPPSSTIITVDGDTPTPKDPSV